MRILHVVSGNLYGGIESTLKVLAEHRAAAPHLEQEFAVCFAGRLSRELTEQGAALHLLGPVRWRWIWTVFRARKKLKRILSERKIDVLICHSPWALGIFGPTARRLVYWAHSPLDSRSWVDKTAIFVQPDGMICNSDYTLRKVRSDFPKCRAQVIHCPVSPPLEKNRVRRKELRAEIRKELGASESDLVFVQVGRMEEWKGHRAFLEAFSNLQSRSNWRVWIAGGAQKAGEEEYLEGLRKFSNSSGIDDRVRFLGQRSDIDRILWGADVFVQPNLSPEPFGVALVEALYRGLPVIGVASGGAAEVLTDQVGVVLPSAEVGSLGRAIEIFLNQEKKPMDYSEKTVQRAEQISSPAQQIQKFSEFLRVLEEGALPG